MSQCQSKEDRNKTQKQKFTVAVKQTQMPWSAGYPFAGKKTLMPAFWINFRTCEKPKLPLLSESQELHQTLAQMFGSQWESAGWQGWVSTRSLQKAPMRCPATGTHPAAAGLPWLCPRGHAVSTPLNITGTRAVITPGQNPPSRTPRTCVVLVLLLYFTYG